MANLDIFENLGARMTFVLGLESKTIIIYESVIFKAPFQKYIHSFGDEINS